MAAKPFYHIETRHGWISKAPTYYVLLVNPRFDLKSLNQVARVHLFYDEDEVLPIDQTQIAVVPKPGLEEAAVAVANRVKAPGTKVELCYSVRTREEAL